MCGNDIILSFRTHNLQDIKDKIRVHEAMIVFDIENLWGSIPLSCWKLTSMET
jgi:hypothetical protein